MSGLNEAAERSAQMSEKRECPICYDTSGPDLVTVLLPDCNHHFHEFCIQNWLSPISLPPTTRAPVRAWSGSLDDVFRQIQGKPTLLHILNQWQHLPELSADDTATLLSEEEALQEVYTQDEDGNDEDGDDDDDNNDDDDDHEMQYEEAAYAPATPPVGSGRLMPPEIRNFPIGNEDDWFEEGEIREVPPPQRPQGLPDGRPFLYDPSYIPRESSFSCPLCRSEVFFGRLVTCHGDTLQLIRVRLRLTDLAYRCLDYVRTDQEQKDREIVTQFLARRHADNIAIGEREIPLTVQNCRTMFKQARLLLLEKAFIYSMEHRIQGAEHLTTVQFGMFFEWFHLQDEQIPLFFDPNPAFGESLGGFEMTREQKQMFMNDPMTFFEQLRLGVGIVPHSYVPEAAPDRAPPSFLVQSLGYLEDVMME
ncbi:MAG: hypothetical protein L6R40_003508 [Gallowayella cf. fulva]|nr:MAG: hypothetical protein L6R40_003508 [Xanthomendoza cf. fulva]